MWLHVYSSSFQSDCCDTGLGCPFFRSLLRHCVPLRKLPECQKMFQVWDPIPLGFPLSSSWHAALALLSSSHETGKVEKKHFWTLVSSFLIAALAEELSSWANGKMLLELGRRESSVLPPPCSGESQVSRISVTLVIIFKSKFSGWVEPHLYLWLGKLKAALLSKFSLYFYQTLAK